MITKAVKINDVDDYIATFPKEIQKRLKEVRKVVIRSAPKADEVISYQMPGYKFHGMLVYFAGYKNHIGFYPGVEPLIKFKKEISIYKSAKGSVQFPHDQPLPLKLIQRLTVFKVKENLQKAKEKKKKKK
ncbi:MAG: DUF1801 domain-containing protein [Bacteroidia bacterium]